MTNLGATRPSGWSLSGLRTATIAVALVFTFALTAGSSEARGEARIVVAPVSVHAPQKIRFAARAPRATKRVVFCVDRRRRWVDRSRRWQFRRTGHLRTARMKSGCHRVMVKAKHRKGRVKRATRVVHIMHDPGFSTKGNERPPENPTASAPSPAPAPTPVPGSKPENTAAPEVSGTPAVGGTLICSPGKWNGAPTPTFTYQWLRDGTIIVLATASTYTVVTEDRGRLLSCNVTATNSEGTASQSSNSLYIPGSDPSQVPLFEGAHLSAFDHSLQPQDITEVPDPLGRGETVFKMTVLNTDITPPNRNPEANLTSTPVIHDGSEIWVRFKFLLPSDFPDFPAGDWLQLSEIYGPPFNGPPPWSIGVTPFGGDTGIGWQRNANYGYDVPWRMPLVKGSWVTVLLHERFATDGWVEMWINGQRITFFDPEGFDYYNPNGVAATQRLYMATMDLSNNESPTRAFIQDYRKVGMLDSATVYFGPLLLGTTRESVGG